MKTFNKSLLAAFVASASLGSTSALAAGETAATVTATGDYSACRSVIDNTPQCESVAYEAIAAGVDSIEHSGFKVNFDGDASGAESTNRFLIDVSGSEFTLGADRLMNESGATIASGVTVIGTGGPYTVDVVLADAPSAPSGSTMEVSASLNTLSQIVIELPAGFTIDVQDADQFTFAGLDIVVEDLNVGDTVNVTFGAARAVGLGFETVSSVTGRAFQVINQLGLTTSWYPSRKNHIINPDGRTTFLTGGDSVAPASNQANFSYTLFDTAVNYGTVFDSGVNAEFTVAGDFSFLDADGDGEIDSGAAVSVSFAGANVTPEFNADMTEATFDTPISIDGAQTAADAGSFTIVTDRMREFPEGVYTVSTEYGFEFSGNSNAASSFSSTANAMSFALGGTTKDLPYMPYGDNISQIIFVQNERGNDAAITLSAVDKDGNPYGPVTLDVQAKGNALTKITGAVADALEAEGFSGNGSLSLQITVDSTDATIYGAYNVGGSDRGYVPSEN